MVAYFSIVVLVLGLAFIFESFLYFTGNSWYYRLGPAMHQQQWQTAAAPEVAVAAIEKAAVGSTLTIRRRDQAFLIRFRWWEFSTWSRVILTVKPGAHGAVLEYQIRPFINPSLFAIAALALFFSGEIQLFAIGYFGLIVGMYVVGWWYETRKLKSLQPIRAKLAELGLSICSRCGYDRFQLPAAQPCPECGHHEAPPIKP